ncbi:toll-like receptor 2 [Protopterus annectens]|uniref:toll-like receptor 2 n=1 Tax=Protopterus annectens TaxID=7888 RepID=UPI001CFBD674|nr:toll-like receptor 2 [Protopterus annectens]XP_043935912.1 toll-like receptor 2 [Protopterus annectens]
MAGLFTHKPGNLLFILLWTHAMPLVVKAQSCIIMGKSANCKGRNLVTVPNNLPISLEVLDLSYNKLTIVQHQDFASLTQLRILYLNYNNISQIEKGSFDKNTLLEYLTIFNNSLTEIPSSALQPLKKLQTLDISNNFYTCARLVGDFGSFHNLSDFSLGGPLIKSLKNYDFVPIQNLSLYKFSLKTASSLLHYEPGALSVVNTQELWLDIALDKHADALPLILKDLCRKSFQLLRFRNLFEFTYYTETSDIFTGLADVYAKKLIFYRGKFNENLMRLVLWNIQKSSIANLSFQSIDFARSLKSTESKIPITHLVLNQLELKDISNPDILRFDWSFTWFQNVTNLHIINVNFNYVPCDVWTELKNVKQLNITYNRLRDGFIYNQRCSYEGSMPVLQYFIARDNKLASLQVLSLLSSSWLHLQYIDVSKNQIKDSTGACNWKPNITTLIMNYNTVSMKIFSCLPTTLQYIDMSNCGLDQLDTKYFLRALNLQTLFLSGNKIKFIPSDWSSPGLQTLYVDGNSFGVISRGSFRMMPSLSQLKADNNPYHCTCELHAFIEETHDTRNLELAGWPDAYICYHPEKFLSTAIKDFDPGRLQCDITLVVAVSVSSTAVIVIFIMLLCWKFDVPWYIKATCQLLQSKYRSHKSGPSRNWNYHAFISYSSSDAEWVRGQLLPRLENATPPYQICIHERDFMPGKWIIDNIVENIENSRKIIFVLSQNFVNSEWCNYELYFAHQRTIGQAFEDIILVVKESINFESLPNKFCKLRKLIHTKTFLEWPIEVNRQVFFWAQLKSVLGRADTGNPRLKQHSIEDKMDNSTELLSVHSEKLATTISEADSTFLCTSHSMEQMPEY